MLIMYRIFFEWMKLFNESIGFRFKWIDVRFLSCIFFFSLYKYELLYMLIVNSFCLWFMYVIKVMIILYIYILVNWYKLYNV